MQVYHGSYMEINEIDLSKCKPNKDFGSGFYVTKYKKQAESWAINIAKRIHYEPFITEFTFYERAFVDERYKTLRFDNYNEEWIDFVVLNRNPQFTTQQHDYDIVEGPIADDKIQNRINDYIDGIIDKTEFLDELKWHEETHQICFCTLNSLQMLVKTDNKYVNHIVRTNEKLIVQLMLDLKIDELQASDLYYKSALFTKLADKNTKLYQKSWEDVYEILKNEINN